MIDPPDQVLGVGQQGLRKKPLRQIEQGPQPQGRVAQQPQQEQQGRKHGQRQEKTGAGGLNADLQLRKCPDPVLDPSQQPALWKFPHDHPSDTKWFRIAYADIENSSVV